MFRAHPFHSLMLQVKELLESKPLPPKVKTGCIASLLSIFSHCTGDQSHDATAVTLSLKDAGPAPSVQARKGRLARARVDPFTGSKPFSEKKLLPRSRLRAHSDASSSLGLFPPSEPAGSERVTKIHAVSSCSESDSESGFASFCDDVPATKRNSLRRETSSILASKPNSSALLMPSVGIIQECETFLASCNRIHAQCKLVRTPRFFFIFPAFHHFFFFTFEKSGMRSRCWCLIYNRIFEVRKRSHMSLVRKICVCQRCESVCCHCS
jgi:hypothetical protein